MPTHTHHMQLLKFLLILFLILLFTPLDAATSTANENSDNQQAGTKHQRQGQR